MVVCLSTCKYDSFSTGLFCVSPAAGREYVGQPVPQASFQYLAIILSGLGAV